MSSAPTVADFEAIVFDVGGVFLLPDPRMMREPMTSRGVVPSPDALERAHYHAIAAMDALGRSDWDLYRRVFARSCGVPPELEAEVAAAMVLGPAAWTHPFATSVDALPAIVDAVRVAIISNASGTIAEMLLAASVCQVGEGPGACVELIVDSHHVGIEKPDARIFQLAVDAMGVAPGRMAYVGDTVHIDVVGALNAGLHPIHFDPFETCRVAEPHHDHVRALAELLGT